MTDATDDVRDAEELFEELKYAHTRGLCDEDCPYCDPDFEPLFNFQG